MKFTERILAFKEGLFKRTQATKVAVAETSIAQKEAIIERYRSELREKAISRVKAQIIKENNREFGDIPEEDLEHLVWVQEQEIKDKFIKTTGIAFMAFLGIY